MVVHCQEVVYYQLRKYPCCDMGKLQSSPLPMDAKKVPSGQGNLQPQNSCGAKQNAATLSFPTDYNLEIRNCKDSVREVRYQVVTNTNCMNLLFRDICGIDQLKKNLSIFYYLRQNCPFFLSFQLYWDSTSSIVAIFLFNLENCIKIETKIYENNNYCGHF